MLGVLGDNSEQVGETIDNAPFPILPSDNVTPVVPFIGSVSAVKEHA